MHRILLSFTVSLKPLKVAMMVLEHELQFHEMNPSSTDKSVVHRFHLQSAFLYKKSHRRRY